jgi:hypothetical protein
VSPHDGRFTAKAGTDLARGQCPFLGQKLTSAVLNDDVSPSAGDNCLDLRLLGLRHSEFVKGLLEIVEKGFPLCCRYL